jgi:hypothetical protein
MNNLLEGFKPMDKLHNRIDSMMKQERDKESKTHGSRIGIIRTYYYCSHCNVGFQAAKPFRNVRFMHNNLYYVIQRPITGLMPACPDCLKRDDVRRVRRHRVKNK